MKCFETILLVLTLLFNTGCSTSAGEIQSNMPPNSENTEIVISEDSTMESKENKILVAYFSATGTTEKIAGYKSS